jgi:addiction module HigA family antidote
VPVYNPPHPGEILRVDYLEPLGLTVTAAARALGVTRKTLSAVVNERAAISPAMAYRLARALDTTPELWINLQSQYDLWQARGTEVKNVRRLVSARAVARL